jgi:hypothetical protein
MMTYAKAVQLWETRRGNAIRKPLGNNTYLYKDGNDFVVRLHSTNVVRIRPDGTYVLNSGGWSSKTTKDRINAYSPACISQKARTWYVYPRNNPLLQEGEKATLPPVFCSGMVVDSNGFMVE